MQYQKMKGAAACIGSDHKTDSPDNYPDFHPSSLARVGSGCREKYLVKLCTKV
jgi:hypothetical protein